MTINECRLSGAGEVDGSPVGAAPRPFMAPSASLSTVANKFPPSSWSLFSLPLVLKGGCFSSHVPCHSFLSSLVSYHNIISFWFYAVFFLYFHYTITVYFFTIFLFFHIVQSPFDF